MFVAQYREIVTKYAQASISQNTQRAYRSAWKRFLYWTKEQCVSPLPVSEDLLGVYLATMAEGGASLSSIELALAAIQKAHSLKGLPSPARVRQFLGTRRTSLQ